MTLQDGLLATLLQPPPIAHEDSDPVMTEMWEPEVSLTSLLSSISGDETRESDDSFIPSESEVSIGSCVPPALVGLGVGFGGKAFKRRRVVSVSASV